MYLNQLLIRGYERFTNHELSFIYCNSYSNFIIVNNYSVVAYYKRNITNYNRSILKFIVKILCHVCILTSNNYNTFVKIKLSEFRSNDKINLVVDNKIPITGSREAD